MEMPASEPSATAWAFWDRWRGPPELIVQIARRAMRAVTGEEGVVGTGRVVVLVPTKHTKELLASAESPKLKVQRTTKDYVVAYEMAKLAEARGEDEEESLLS